MQLFVSKLLLCQLERIWRTKKTEESHEAYRRQTQKLNQMIRTVKEEYNAAHGDGPVSYLRHSLSSALYGLLCRWPHMIIVYALRARHLICMILNHNSTKPSSVK